MKNIIGIVGFMGSGKGTAGDYLVSKYNFKSASFAHALKDAVSCIFNWPRNLLEGDTAESRAWRELPDDYWSQKMEKPVTPRWVLQYIGTDVLRNHFVDNIWIWSLEKRLLDSDNSIVITDVRFPNEVKLIQKLGGKLIWVRRQPEPTWIDIALTDKTAMSLQPNVHSSEYAWLGIADYKVIWNDSSLEAFYAKIDSVVND